MNESKQTENQIIKVPPDTNEVSCDGGGSITGHPKVWYSFDNTNFVACNYCGRLFSKSS